MSINKVITPMTELSDPPSYIFTDPKGSKEKYNLHYGIR